MSDDLTRRIVNESHGVSVKVGRTNGRPAYHLIHDANGVSVLRQALAEPTVERASNPDVRAVAEAVGELEPDLDFNETQISIAIHFERAIEFAYDKGSGVIEQRKLFPKVSYAAPNGIVVTGDDIDRQDVRAFRVDRIQGEVKVV